MIDSIRQEITGILQGLGYTVSEPEITSINELRTIVSELDDEDYPYCTIAFGDGVDVPKSEQQSIGYFWIIENLNINTIYNVKKEELPPIREAEERKIRDAIADYLRSGTNNACDWYIESVRRAFLPGLRAEMAPSGGLAVKSKIKYRIKERS